MHPTIRDELAEAGPADLRYQAQCDPRAHAVRRARRTPARLNADDAQCQALFASSLQPSDALGAGVVAEAIRVTLLQLGTDGCTARMAQEFGDHPEAAAERMCWVRSVLSCPEATSRRLAAGREWQR
jgi:hypothetical protein